MPPSTRAPARNRAGRALRAALAVGAFLGVALSACGSSTANPTEPNSARVAPAIALNGTLTLTAPFALIARFTDDISTAAATGATCVDAARGFLQDGIRYQPPHNPQGQTFDTLDGAHHSVTITLHVGGYNGPATYGKPNVFGDEGLQLLQVDGYSYGSFLGGDVNLRVGADDSGQLTFTKLTLIPPTPAAAAAATSGTPPPPTPKPTPLPAALPLTGTLTWTCVQVRAPTPTPLPTPSPGVVATAPPPAATPAPAPTPTPKH
ncbi:MAG TPA: hypothetical protein VI316_06055 [Candidatus Dormibacteraeota bacterium]